MQKAKSFTPQCYLLLNLVLALYIVPATANLTCSYANTEGLCGQLNGCTWDSSTCTGTYVPPSNKCQTNRCFFIDPLSSTSQNPVGSTSDPFKDLSQAWDYIRTLPPMTLRLKIYVVCRPDLDKPLIEVTKSTQMDRNAKVMPIFNEGRYKLSFQKAFDSMHQQKATGKDMCGLNLIKPNLYAGIVGAEFKGHSVHLPVSFICGEGRVGSDINYSIFKDMNQDGLDINIVNLQPANHFNFNFNVMDNCNYGFIGKSVTHHMLYRDNVFKNIRINQSLILVEDAHYYFERNTVTNISQLQPSAKLVNIRTLHSNYQWAQATYNKITDTNITLFFMVGQFHMNVLHNKFTNIHFIEPQQNPLITIQGIGHAFSMYWIYWNDYANITVRQTFMLMDTGNYQFYKNNWHNISRYRLPNSELTEYDIPLRERSFGVCGTFGFFSTIILHTCDIKYIDYDCFNFQQSLYYVYKTKFNNTDFVLDKPNYYDGQDPNSEFAGMTWVKSSEAHTNDQFSLYAYSTFIKNGGNPKTGGAISWVSTTKNPIFVRDCKFEGLKAQYGGAIYVAATNGIVQMVRSDFKENKALYDGGGVYFSSASSFYGKTAYMTYYVNSTFANNTAGKNGGAIYQDFTTINFENITINNNSAHNGGGIYMIKYGQIDIQDFIQAVARRKGKWMYIHPFAVEFKSVKFWNNTATGLGPAAHYLFDAKTAFNVTNLEDTATYEDNKLVNVQQGRTWGMEEIAIQKPKYIQFKFYKIITLQKVTKLTNLQEFISTEGNTKLSETIIIENNQIPKDFILRVKSGHTLLEIIEICILDQFKEVMTTINDETIDFTFQALNQGDRVRFNSLPMSFKNGRLLMKEELSFQGEASVECVLHIKSTTQQSSLLKDANLSINLPFKVVFKACDVGDVYDPKSFQCRTCPEATYSYGDPYDPSSTCESCIESAYCLGGAIMPPKPGYYKYEEVSTSISSCEIPEKCLGGYINEKYYPQGVCSDDTSGLVCSQCALDGHAKFSGKGKCRDCRNDGLYHLKFLFIFAIQFLSIALSSSLNAVRVGKIRKAKEKGEEYNAPDLNPYLRVLVNFLLMQSVLNQFSFPWPGYTRSFFSSISNIMPTNEQGFSIDCLVALASDYSHVFYARLVMITLKPILFWAIAIAIYFIVRKIKHKKVCMAQFKRTSLSLFLSIAYITRTEVIVSNLSMIQCTNIGTPSKPMSVLKLNPNIECFAGSHTLWFVFFSFPILLFQQFILPYILFRKVKKGIHNSEIRVNLRFLFYGIREKYWYWIFVTNMRRDILLINLYVLQFIAPGGQVIISFLSLLFFTEWHRRAHPYDDKRINKLELISLSTTLVMLIAGTYYFFDDVNETGFFSYLFALLGFIGMAAFFVLYLIYVGAVIKQIKKGEQLNHYKDCVKNNEINLRALTKHESQVYMISPKNGNDSADRLGTFSEDGTKTSKFKELNLNNSNFQSREDSDSSQGEHQHFNTIAPASKFSYNPMQEQRDRMPHSPTNNDNNIEVEIEEQDDNHYENFDKEQKSDLDDLPNIFAQRDANQSQSQEEEENEKNITKNNDKSLIKQNSAEQNTPNDNSQINQNGVKNIDINSINRASFSRQEGEDLMNQVFSPTNLLFDQGQTEARLKGTEQNIVPESGQSIQSHVDFKFMNKQSVADFEQIMEDNKAKVQDESEKSENNENQGEQAPIELSWDDDDDDQN